MAQSEILRGGIRLPRSASRTERDTFVKLLSFVDPEAEHGFGFEGKLLRPGSLLTPAQLRPADHFPEIPIVLEYLPGTKNGRRREQLYILWRLDWSTHEWRELGRAVSESWHWANDLRPLAVRALKEARSKHALELQPDFPAIERRIAQFLDAELKPLEAGDRVRVLAMLHDQLATKLLR